MFSKGHHKNVQCGGGGQLSFIEDKGIVIWKAMLIR